MCLGFQRVVHHSLAVPACAQLALQTSPTTVESWFPWAARGLSRVCVDTGDCDSVARRGLATLN